MNVILRGSILYASECYYNLTENEIRRIERIEERYLRKIFQTPKTCPIVQLYLEFGQWPARFEIQKMRCLYLKNILSQKEHSQIFMFFKLQKESPIKGDWVSTVMKDLSDLRIYETMDEIKEMSRNKFKNLIKSRIEVNALDYLQKKRGSKGNEIKLTRLEMSEYLLPFNNKLSIEEKRKMFEHRNRMTKIPYNFGKKEEKCVCGNLENISHIYSCKSLNKNEFRILFNEFYNGNLEQQIEIFKRLENNLEMRKKTRLITMRSKPDYVEFVLL